MVSTNTKIGERTKIYNPELSNIFDAYIGLDCTIHSHVWIGHGVKIGNRVKIQAFAFIPDGVTLEDEVFIGPAVVMTNDKYPPSHGKGWQGTLVKKGASIGARSVVLPGIIIGEGALIGAGSVVTKNVPNNEIWAGNPARKLKRKLWKKIVNFALSKIRNALQRLLS